VFERAKKFHALDRAAIVTGGLYDKSGILAPEAANRNTVEYTMQKTSIKYTPNTTICEGLLSKYGFIPQNFRHSSVFLRH
jgi:hypothetical protein